MSAISTRTLIAASALTLCSLLAAGCTTTGMDARQGAGSSKATLDAESDATLARLYAEVPGARAIGTSAKGILVFPAVVGGSFGVGVEYGRGALRASDSPRRYYSVAVGSVGWQVGAQSKAIVYMFTTTDALDKFRGSNGWTAGVDATVSVANVGANGSIDTATASSPVVGFVMANGGLEVGASVQGMKITEVRM